MRKGEKRELRKRILAAIMVFTMVFTLISPSVFAAENDVSYQYYDDNGDLQTGTKASSEYTSVTDQTTWGETGTTTWYVVDSSVTISSRITVNGTVNLILVDGCTLTASEGIQVESGNSITIYGQDSGTGALNATGSQYNAGIGSNGNSTSGTTAGDITICGGKIIATGGNGTNDSGAYREKNSGAGIGGGGEGAGSYITISGGTITATGGACDGSGYWCSGAGIGGGGYGGAGSYITISGGTIKASSTYGAGIGSGGSGSGKGSNITISNGYIAASSTGGGDAIGGGYSSGGSSDIIITGGYFADSSATTGVSGTGKVYSRDVYSGYEVFSNTADETKEAYPVFVAKAMTVTISGTATYGQTLTATTPELVSVTGYQWLRGGSEISGATGSTYTLTADDVGKEISVKITYGSDSTVTSDVVTVAKATLTASIIGSTSKAYDGTTTVTDAENLSITFDGAVGSDSPTATASYAYEDAALGTSKTIKATDITLTGSWSNYYTLSNTEATADVGTITKATPTVSLTGNASKTYTGSAIEIDSNATVTLVSGEIYDGSITYTYYTDQACENKTSSTDSGASSDGGAPVNAGTYYVKASIAEQTNYEAATSEAVTLTINPATITADDFTVTQLDGEDTVTLSTGEAVDINFTGSEIKPTVATANGSLVTSSDYNVTYDTNTSVGTGTVTITGKSNFTDELKYTFNIVDNVAPTGTITIDEKSWSVFLGSVSYGLFYKTTKTVSVSASDNDGVAKTEYYLSSTAISDTGNLSGVAWTKFTNTFNINPNSKYFIYVKITDNSDNYIIINSDGVVLYTDSEQDTESIEFTRTETNNVTAEVTLNGNTVSGISCTGGSLTDSSLSADTDYSVDASGEITFKNSWLSTLAAGTYTLTVSYNPQGETYVSGNKNDAPSTTTITLTVNKAEGSVTITNASALSKTYDGDAVTTPTYDSLSTGAATIEYKVADADDDTYSTIAPVNAGEYTVRVTVEEDDNYKKASATANFTIGKAAGSVTIANVSALSKTYDGDEVTAPTYESLSTGAVTIEYKVADADDDTYSTIAPMEAGNYTVRVTVEADTNYEEASATADFTISKREITVTIDSKTSIYGDDIETLTAEVTDGSVVNGDTDIYSLSTTATSESVVGTYDITGKAENANYSIAFENEADAYEITQRPITVTVDNKTSIYGDDIETLTAKVTDGSIVNGDTAYSLSTTATNESAVGTYNITGTTENSNYSVTFVNEADAYEITQRPITVTVDNNTSIYGDDIKTLTAEVTDGSVVNGDTDIYSLSTTATSESVVGTYDITGKAENSNYSVTFVNEDDAYTITARELTVTVTVADKVYDGTNTATIESAELNNIANNDDVTLKYGTAIFDGVNIGSDIAITFTDDFSLEGEASVLANYTLTQPAGVTADITKIPVTVTVDDVIRDYGDDNPTFTYTITDGELFGDDTEDDLSITLSTDADTDSAVGSYTVSGTSDSDRYDVTVVDGTLTVIVLTDLPEQEFPDDGAIHKIAIELGNLKVPDSFKNNPNLNTVEKIEAVLKTIISKQSGYSETNVVVYELTLMVSYDGGLTWEVATEENFPEDGLTVILPYPDGTGKDTHDFTVVHMFTSTAFGKTPGDTESPEVTKKDEGIQVTVTGLSPIAIGWTEIVSEAEPATEITTDTTEAEEVTETETAAETDSVNTGDNTPIWLCWIMMAVSGIGIIGICAYRRRKRR